MLTRRVTFRFAAGAVSRSATRSEIRLPLRFAAQSNTAFQSSGIGLLTTSRTYATPSKPKKGSIGESSSRATRPRKTEEQKAKEKDEKEAKAAAAKEKAALKKAQDLEKKTKAQEKKKKQQEQAKKQKERAAAKKASAKTKAKKVVKTTLTEEQQARKKAREQQVELRKLKEQALSPPRQSNVTAWTMYNNEHITEAMKTREPGANTHEFLSKAVKEASAQYKHLNPSQLEVGKRVCILAFGVL